MQGIGSLISALGEGPDTEAIHLTKGELKKVQKTLGQKGKRNPLTGLLGFWSEADQDAMEDAMGYGPSAGPTGGVEGDSGDPAGIAAAVMNAELDAVDKYGGDYDPSDLYVDDSGGDSWGINRLPVTTIQNVWGGGPGGSTALTIGGRDRELDDRAQRMLEEEAEELDLDFQDPDPQEEGILSISEIEGMIDQSQRDTTMDWDEEVKRTGLITTLLNHLMGFGWAPGVDVRATYAPGVNKTTWSPLEAAVDVLTAGAGSPLVSGLAGLLGLQGAARDFDPTTVTFDNRDQERTPDKTVEEYAKVDEDESGRSIADRTLETVASFFQGSAIPGDPNQDLNLYPDSDSNGSDNQLRRTIKIAQALNDQADIDPEPEVPSNIDLDMVDLIDRKNWYRRYQEAGGEPIFGRTEFAGPAYYEEVA